jgi:hypothetical protein
VGTSGFPLATITSGAQSGSQQPLGVSTNNDLSSNTSLFSSTQPNPYFQQVGFSTGAN